MTKIGLIAGTGIDELLFTERFKESKIETEFGLIIAKEGKVAGKEIVFINRHGPDYLPPHALNSRGSIEALMVRGAERIIAVAAVGSMNTKMKPGDFVLLSDFVDFTKGRITYFNPTQFIDVSYPYDEKMRRLFLKTAKSLKIRVHPSAVYVCTEGPRFETKAEIKMFRKWGGDVVGMTQVPEVVLAAEKKMPYAVIAVVTNFAAGISKTKISSAEVATMMRMKKQILSKWIVSLVNEL